MKKLVMFALVVTSLAASAAAQTAASFSGKWDGTFKMQRPDGTEGSDNTIQLNLSQKAKALTGTAGPPEEQWPIAKGAVNAGKATFEVQQPNGPLFKFTLTIEKGHLVGDMAGERDGVVRGHAKVDLTKAKQFPAGARRRAHQLTPPIGIGKLGLWALCQSTRCLRARSFS